MHLRIWVNISFKSKRYTRLRLWLHFVAIFLDFAASLSYKLRMEKKEKSIEEFKALVKKQLNLEYLERKRRNSSYSLRAFARSLGLDSTFLSRIMSGKRPVTEKTAFRIADQINISVKDIMRAKKERPLLSNHQFSLISRWYFFVLLELGKLGQFKNDREWMAKKMGITRTEVDASIDLLVGEGLLTAGPHHWEPHLLESRWDGINDPSKTKKAYQVEILKKGIEAINEIPTSQREAYSLSFAANSELLPLVKEKLRKLCDEISDIAELQDNKTDVYQLNYTFFPLTKPSERNGK